MSDVTGDHGILSPIKGVLQSAALGLLEAAAATRVPDIDADAWTARELGAALAAEDAHGLSVDEAGALTLYTMDGELYAELNRRLRARDRSVIKPFFPYLRLMLQARSKLPRYQGIVWRGVAGVDLRAHFTRGQEIFWWAFSSCTKEVSTLTRNPLFFGMAGVRTQFLIEVLAGVDIVRYSIFQDEASEAEVLLYPGTKFLVVDCTELSSELFQVHLREVPVPVHLIS